ncbi:peptide MFS transporter [Vitreimonas flagellata]|uniref:peptide MFS transporter n=1 Tax=Vitreimonas flagellata TaxID=2560861 RepID=UPI001EF9B588|nr:peptide MFS transporter [Vitreimonas flagellata]
MTDQTAGAGADEKTFMGHPRGLVTLFFTEMWERFSFYGMRALLVIYLTQHFLFSDDKAQGLYGAYAALVYLIPVIGGVIADRFLGSRKAVTIGAVFLVLGHFGMAFEGRGSVQEITFAGETFDIISEGRGEERELFLVAPGEVRYPVTFSAEGMAIEGAADAFPAMVPTADYALSTRPDFMNLGGLSIPYEQILYLSLAFIIIGVGFLKANISTTVGALYAPGDPRRDGGFTIFYMGINLGAFLATLACGYLGQTYGWAYGFGLAGIGMTFGLIQYLMGQKWLKGRAEPPKPISATFEGLFWILGLVAVIPAWLLVQQTELMETALPILVPGLFAAVIAFALIGFKGLERTQMLAALIMIIFSVIFWMLFEQAGSSLSLFAERNTDLTVVPGVTMTAAQTQSFNAGYIVLLALPFSAMWIWLAKRKMEPSTPVKFALGLIQVGLGFFILVAGAQFAGDDFKVPLIFLALLYLLHTTGELFLSPVGLSMITKLSPARVVGLMMGVWFLSSSLAHILAAIIAQQTSSDTVAGQVVDLGAQLNTYVTTFQQVGMWGIAAGVILLAISPFLKKWMGDVR